MNERYVWGDSKKVEERRIKGESQEIIILYNMEKVNDKFYTPTKPLETSFILEESEVMEV